MSRIRDPYVRFRESDEAKASSYSIVPSFSLAVQALFLRHLPMSLISRFVHEKSKY
jgi:hypothetical protein